VSGRVVVMTKFVLILVNGSCQEDLSAMDLRLLHLASDKAVGGEP